MRGPGHRPSQILLRIPGYPLNLSAPAHPKKQTIAERVGLKEKQVQRLIRDLQQRGYVKRNVRKTPHGQTSNSYDLSGLVKKLQELAPEFLEAAAAKRKAERRGGLKAKTA